MKVLITGANGFVGKSISNFLNQTDNIEVIAYGRDKLNLLDYDNVKRVTEDIKPNAIVHCAIKGGTRMDVDTQSTCDDNLLMYKNLKSCRSNFESLINIASGAEFDRKFDINREVEESLTKRSPNDFYGKAKNLISQDVLMTDQFYNLRIFGCFGPLETESRLLKSTFKRMSNDERITIENDREMDFVHVDDLARTIHFYLKNAENEKALEKDVNVVYSDKMRVSEIVKNFISCSGKDQKIDVISTSSLNYTGSHEKLEKLRISSLSGSSLKKSIAKYYNELIDNQGDL